MSRTTSWLATALLLAFNLVVSGAIHDQLFTNDLTASELNDATGGGVVPGYWLLVPLLTIFVLVPVTLVASLIVVGIIRSGRADPVVETEASTEAAIGSSPSQSTSPPPSTPPPPSMPPPPGAAPPPPRPTSTEAGLAQPDGLFAQVFFLTFLVFSVAGHVLLAVTDFAR